MAGSNSSGALASFKNKMQTLRDDLEKTREDYEEKCRELEAEKINKNQVENDFHSVSRKLQLIEGLHETAETKAEDACKRLEEITKMVDEHERSKRVLENRQTIDDDRIESLESNLKVAKMAAVEAEKNFEETFRKLKMTESELERAEDRADTTERKLKEIDTELLVVTSTLKSLEHNESKATEKEDTMEDTIRDLNLKLKEAEYRASDGERAVNKLQRDMDNCEEELLRERAANKALKEELENAFNEIANF